MSISPTCPDVTGQQLIAVVQRAAAAGTLALLSFHGVGGEYLSVSRQAHDELLQYLAEHRDVCWTASFISIMRHVRGAQGCADAFSISRCSNR